jgi:hypothetical protein
MFQDARWPTRGVHAGHTTLATLDMESGELAPTRVRRPATITLEAGASHIRRPRSSRRRGITCDPRNVALTIAHRQRGIDWASSTSRGAASSGSAAAARPASQVPRVGRELGIAPPARAAALLP